jgi:hypothetical protein
MKTRGGTEPLGKFTVYGFITPPPHTHTPWWTTEPDQTPPSFFPSSPPFFFPFLLRVCQCEGHELEEKKRRYLVSCGVVDVVSNKQLRAITVTYDLVW